jgi:5'-3' exonuclease
MNLIFDGNYLFYKTLFIFGGYSSGSSLLDSKKDQDMFIRKVATDFSYSVRTFGNPDRIIFTVDSRSWRKEVLIEDGKYKSNREEKDSKINWDAFYSCINEFTEILKSKKVIVSKQERAEGDDLMHLWSDSFYQKGMDSVIISGDQDMYQCIKFDGTNFVTVYNPNSKSRKLAVSSGFQEWINKEDHDIFDASTYMNRNKDVIQDVARQCSVEVVDPKYLIFEKVITGDSGDTVPSVWTWKKGDRVYRITPNKASRIYEILNLTKKVEDVFDLPNRAEEISNAISVACSQSPSADAIKERLERNLKLVFLDSRVIPQDIQDTFSRTFEDSWNKKELGVQVYDMKSFLQGTRFVTDGKSFESDFFSSF